MTKADEEQLLRNVREMKEEIHTLKIRVIGDPFAQPEPIVGVLDILRTHTLDLYGDEKIQHEGLKPKVKHLEDGYKKWVGIIVGVNGTAGIVILILLNWSTIKSWFTP